ncbi:MAG: hypothetical protein N3A59_06970 [Thermodesulfovibrionales bacterium]|nr:hypothetical protein [Thermodesulfovibrionales bacterium]
MKLLKILTVSFLVLMLTLSVSFAMKNLPEDRGKALFNDPKFAGGSKSCNQCHPNGKGLENAANKKEFKIMGKTLKSLEDAINLCIVEANKGKAINVNSQEMKDLVAYIKILQAR